MLRNNKIVTKAVKYLKILVGQKSSWRFLSKIDTLQSVLISELGKVLEIQSFKKYSSTFLSTSK